ncbi:lipopolysaccharide biosynthesis protein [Pontibacter rugosus]|uniref:Lipopolysaccharide biosynthesis protein n=1 Tax=Pontibacter rugosus TaxID=1745966 RepID=A0ABW3SJC6_9BACT
MLRKLFSHAAIYGLAAQLPRVAGVLALPVITPYLTTVDYGVAGVMSAYLAALTLIHSLGLGTVEMNSFVKYPLRYKWIWRQIHGFMLLWSILYSCIMFAVLYAAVPDEAIENRSMLVLLQVVPVAFLAPTTGYGGITFLLRQQPMAIAWRSFLVGVVMVALNVYFIAELRLGYMGWFYASFCSEVLHFFLYFKKVYFQEKIWPIFNFKWHRIRHSLKVGLPLVPHNFSSFLLDASDKLVLDALKIPIARIGFYSLASSFGLYFSAATNALEQAASPFYYKYYGNAADKTALLAARKMTIIMQGLFLAVTFIAALWMREVFQLLIKNEELQQAYPLAIIILMGYNYRPMYWAVVNRLAYEEKTKVLWKISLVAGLGNVLLNLLLIPLYGVEAAAFTTFAALMYMGYSGFLLKEYKHLPRVPHYPLLWLLVTIGFMFLVYYLSEAAVSVKAILSFILAVIALVLITFKIRFRSR